VGDGGRLVLHLGRRLRRDLLDLLGRVLGGRRKLVLHLATGIHRLLLDGVDVGAQLLRGVLLGVGLRKDRRQQ
jgi:hypothetical protein